MMIIDVLLVSHAILTIYFYQQAPTIRSEIVLFNYQQRTNNATICQLFCIQAVMQQHKMAPGARN